MKISMPIRGKIGPCHQMAGKYGISSENGLVLIGAWSTRVVGEDHTHAFELLLTDTGYRTWHWPSTVLGGPAEYADEVLDLGVTRVTATALSPQTYAVASEAVAGDLYIDERGAHAVGERLTARSANMFDLSTHEARDVHSGRGFICKKWRLTAFREDDVVFEVEMGSV
jgi:hypothetical protein